MMPPMSGSTRFEERVRNPGGTRGGFGEFLLGFAFLCAGGYMLLQRTIVTGGFWDFFGWGSQSFGFTLVPLCIGLGFLFFDSRSFVGKLLVLASSIFIFVGILLSLRIHFQATSLFGLITMLVLLFGGVGLMARSFRDHDRR